MPELERVDLTVRTAMRCATPAKEAPAAVEARRAERHDARPAPELRATAIAPVSANHEALGGSPLDPRLTFASFVTGRRPAGTALTIAFARGSRASWWSRWARSARNCGWAS